MEPKNLDSMAEEIAKTLKGLSLAEAQTVLSLAGKWVINSAVLP